MGAHAGRFALLLSVIAQHTRQNAGQQQPNEGKVIVRLGENPMVLRGWTIIDNRGQRVDVSLNGLQTGLPLAASLFKFDGPDAGQIRRGAN